jgi:glutaconyl-CoA decarboxylase
VGGGGILSGMLPKGYFDEEGAEALINAAKQYKTKPPVSVEIHYDETGFSRYVFEKETGVPDGLKAYPRPRCCCREASGDRGRTNAGGWTTRSVRS